MTPIELEVLLHCYYSAEPWEKRHRESEAVDQAHMFLNGNDLIENCGNGYRTTKRGDFMVKEGLRKVQIPITKKVFTFPEKKS